MSQKKELQEKAKALGLSIEGLTTKQLKEVIEKHNENSEPKVLDMEGKEVKQEAPQQAPPLKLSIEEANRFLSIIDIMMVDDPRGKGLQAHFTKMLQSQNPELRPQNPQPQPQ